MPLARDNNGVWRLRSQSKYFLVDICLRASVLACCHRTSLFVGRQLKCRVS